MLCCNWIEWLEHLFILNAHFPFNNIHVKWEECHSASQQWFVLSLVFKAFSNLWFCRETVHEDCLYTLALKGEESKEKLFWNVEDPVRRRIDYGQIRFLKIYHSKQEVTKTDIDKGKTAKSHMRNSDRISFCKGLSLQRIKWSLLKSVIDVNGEHRFKRELNTFGAGSECSHAVIREIIVHKMVSYHTWWFVFSAARGKGLMDHVLFSGLLLLVCL